MKRMMLVVALIMAMVSSGCSVFMNREYKNILYNQAGWARATSNKAKSGDLTEVQMVRALDTNAQAWEKFVKAIEGRK